VINLFIFLIIALFSNTFFCAIKKPLSKKELITAIERKISDFAYIEMRPELIGHFYNEDCKTIKKVNENKVLLSSLEDTSIYELNSSEKSSVYKELFWQKSYRQNDVVPLSETKFAAARNNKIEIYDTQKQSVIFEFENPYTSALKRYKDRLLAIDYLGNLREFSLGPIKILREKNYSDRLEALEVLDKNRCAVGGASQSFIIDLETFTTIAQFPIHIENRNGLAYCGNEVLAVADKQNRYESVSLWNLKNKKEVAIFKGQGLCNCIKFLGKNFLAAGFECGKIYLWDIKNKVQIVSILISCHHGPRCIEPIDSYSFLVGYDYRAGKLDLSWLQFDTVSKEKLQALLIMLKSKNTTTENVFSNIKTILSKN